MSGVKLLNAVCLVLVAGCANRGHETPRSYYQPLPSEALELRTLNARPDHEGAAAAVDLLRLLEGCVVIANDGQPLGLITQNEFAPNSILNQFGIYGNQFSATSIFNQFGAYGGQFSQLSPFNPFTLSPPRIISPAGKLVGYLSTNRLKVPAIDPHALMALLKGHGNVTETQIEGEFQGWDGDSLWKMANGQIWKQAQYAYHYHYAYRPKVWIYESGGSHLMKVDGVNEEVKVEMLAGSGNETFISEVNRDGSIIKLVDGSIYAVDALGQIKTTLWLPAQKVIKDQDRLINLDKGQSVKASSLK